MIFLDCYLSNSNSMEELEKSLRPLLNNENANFMELMKKLKIESDTESTFML